MRQLEEFSKRLYKNARLLQVGGWGKEAINKRWKITRTVSGHLPLGEGQESMMQGAGVRAEGPGDRLPHWFSPENSRLAH